MGCRRPVRAWRLRVIDGRTQRSRNAEVADLDESVLPDEAVRRLDVAMQDAALCRGREPASHLKSRVHRRRGRQRAVAVQAVGEGLPHRLERDGRTTIDLVGAEHVHAIRVVDRRRQLTLAQKAIALTWLRRGAAMTFSAT